LKLLEVTVLGQPVTKKNSQRIVRIGQYHKILPSKQYTDYQSEAVSQLEQLRASMLKIDRPVNARYVYYMPSKRRVDLTNLMEATDDILVAAHVLADDNRDIVAAHDGSRVLYDKKIPRVEITLEEMEDEYEQWKDNG
jgi:Holliday junction resolvase RusA-like endonuclease